MPEDITTAKPRPGELAVTGEYLAEQEAELFLFRELGDTVKGIVQAARREVTEINGKVKKDPRGDPKRHLEILLLDDDKEVVVQIQSRNQKEALAQACAEAGIRGLAIGDYFSMTYTHDDAPIQRGNRELTAARGYSAEVRTS